jgi:hypothetical protein
MAGQDSLDVRLPLGRAGTGLSVSLHVPRQGLKALPPPDIVFTAPHALREPGRTPPFSSFLGEKPAVKSGDHPDSTQ